MKVKLDPGAFMPERAHPDDAGLDIRSPVDTIVPAFGSAVIDTGVHVEIPYSAVGFLKSKSGLHFFYGISSEGVVDCGYTGSIRVKLVNHTDEPYHVHYGDKISQLVVIPIYLPTPELVDELPETDRGGHGFGSTGR